MLIGFEEFDFFDFICVDDFFSKVMYRIVWEGMFYVGDYVFFFCNIC